MKKARIVVAALVICLPALGSADDGLYQNTLRGVLSARVGLAYHQPAPFLIGFGVNFNQKLNPNAPASWLVRDLKVEANMLFGEYYTRESLPMGRSLVFGGNLLTMFAVREKIDLLVGFQIVESARFYPYYRSNGVKVGMRYHFNDEQALEVALAPVSSYRSNSAVSSVSLMIGFIATPDYWKIVRNRQ